MNKFGKRITEVTHSATVFLDKIFRQGKGKPMRLTNEQCNVLDELTRRTKMDCWFYIDSQNRIHDLEDGGRFLSVEEAISYIFDGLPYHDVEKDFAELGLSKKDCKVFRHLLRATTRSLNVAKI